MEVRWVQGALWSSGRFDPGLSPHFGTFCRHHADRHRKWHREHLGLGARGRRTAVAELDDRFPGRFLLGIGTSHSVIVEDYRKPYSRMVEYLDALDALDSTGPARSPDSGCARPSDARAGCSRSAGHAVFS